MDADAGLDAVRFAADVEAQDVDAALGGPLQTFNDFQSSGLAGSVRAENTKYFSLLDGKGNVVHRRKGTEPFNQACYPNCL